MTGKTIKKYGNANLFKTSMINLISIFRKIIKSTIRNRNINTINLSGF